VLEDDESSANYDPSMGNLTVTLTKANKGQFFDDLDLLAKLLAPRRSVQDPSPSIEVLSAENRLEEDLVAKTEALSLERGEFAEGKPLKSRTSIYTNFFFSLHSRRERLAISSKGSGRAKHLVSITLWFFGHVFWISQACNSHGK